jgi:hypothetical protein
MHKYKSLREGTKRVGKIAKGYASGGVVSATDRVHKIAKGYAEGGLVDEFDDGLDGDLGMLPDEMGEARLDRPARKPAGNTTVNVIVQAPQKDLGMPPMPPKPPMMAPPMPPPQPPPMAGPGGPPAPGGPPGGLPPGPIRKNGGRVGFKSGGVVRRASGGKVQKRQDGGEVLEDGEGPGGIHGYIGRRAVRDVKQGLLDGALGTGAILAGGALAGPTGGASYPIGYGLGGANLAKGAGNMLEGVRKATVSGKYKRMGAEPSGPPSQEDIDRGYDVKKASGGPVKRASGGSVPSGLKDAGAGGAKGRLEKIKDYGKNSKAKK